MKAGRWSVAWRLHSVRKPNRDAGRIAVNATDVTFDFASFKAAFERRDLARWAAFYADDAEWIEYQPSLSSREPRRMRGKRQIGDFLRWVSRAEIDVHLSDEVV